MSDGSGGEDSYKRDCTFTNNGRTPFLCATGAFVSLAIVMILLFRPLLSYLSISGLDPSRFMTYVPHDNDNPGTLKASLLFDIIWFLFLGAECMLLEGLSNELDHIKEWPISESDYYCVETRKGVFAVAGIIGITMVFLASRLSMTALEAQ
ncbi:uncharacterized protein [Rutidosis leptorrhynchoides]|uniref:uncharacterized protein n=1 Tax=Rutidosis leptorrhynchoides TaxID=125765 RepID=UPI003A999D6F